MTTTTTKYYGNHTCQSFQFLLLLLILDGRALHRGSSDLVRTRGIDSSAKLLNQSLLQCQFKAASAYQALDKHVYSAPSDRIGRFQTPSVAGLTMKKAARIAKQATAPDAFEARRRPASRRALNSMKLLNLGIRRPASMTTALCARCPTRTPSAPSETATACCGASPATPCSPPARPRRKLRRL